MALDTVCPFIPMYPNGQPQGDFYVNGFSAPVLIAKRSASGSTRHEWFGYLNIATARTCFLSLSIPAKDLVLTTQASSSPLSGNRSN